MLDKDPGSWSDWWEWLSQHAPFLHAVLLSIAIAVVRVIYGGGKWRQVLGEGVLCGLLTLAAISGMEWFGVPQSAANFVGGLIGFVGVKKIGERLDKFLDRKADKADIA